MDLSQPMDPAVTKRAIRSAYDGWAPWYDVREAFFDILAIRRLRKRFIAGSMGRVLEVAAGTGKNLKYYPVSCRIVAGDLSAGMLEVARKRAGRLGIDTAFLLLDGEALPFPGGAFDTVVSSLTLCTYPDPASVLREMARVCRPEGRLLLLEHGRSDRPRLGRWQDRTADRHARDLGCRWNREPLEIVRGAGLRVLDARRTFLGVFHEITAAPGR